MSDYRRRIERLEPKAQDNERFMEAGRRIYQEMCRWREWLLSYGPPTRFDQGEIDEAARYCDDFEPTDAVAL